MHKMPAVEIEEQDASYWKELGNSHFKQKRYKSAIECYQKAININPEFKEPYYNMALCYKLIDEIVPAVLNFRQAIKIDPLHVKAVYNLAEILFNKRNIAGGLEVIREYYAAGGTDRRLEELREEHKDDVNYQSYIEITQNGVARFDAEKTPTSIQGFVTEELTMCFAIIIVNAKKTRYSFIHSPASMLDGTFQTECQWVGSGTIILVPGCCYKDPKFTKDLNGMRIVLQILAAGQKFKIDTTSYNSFTGSVAIDRFANIRSIPPTFDSTHSKFFGGICSDGRFSMEFCPIGITDPNIVIRHTINIINYCAIYYNEGLFQTLDLQWNLNQWTNFSGLTTLGKKYFEKYRREGTIPDKPLVQYFDYYKILEDEMTQTYEQANNDYVGKDFVSATFGYEKFITLAQQLYVTTGDKVSTAQTRLIACEPQIKAKIANPKC